MPRFLSRLSSIESALINQSFSLRGQRLYVVSVRKTLSGVLEIASAKPLAPISPDEISW